MIVHTTKLRVEKVSAKSMYDFMLNCTDEQYNKWWPGTHLAWHTIKRVPGDMGNLIYFDELVGRRRLRFHAIVRTARPNSKLIWQMKKGLLLPAWLSIQFKDAGDGIELTHVLSMGFRGFGKILDPVVRLLYFNEQFSHDLTDHANTEFPKLGKLLSK